MRPPKRPRRRPTDEWSELQPAFQWPEQRTYELIRPVVLFGQPPAERSEQTGVSPRTIYRQAESFERSGFAGLLPTGRVVRRGWLPAVLWHTIRAVKAEYPVLTARGPLALQRVPDH